MIIYLEFDVCNENYIKIWIVYNSNFNDLECLFISKMSEQTFISESIPKGCTIINM